MVVCFGGLYAQVGDEIPYKTAGNPFRTQPRDLTWTNLLCPQKDLVVFWDSGSDSLLMPNRADAARSKPRDQKSLHFT